MPGESERARAGTQRFSDNLPRLMGLHGLSSNFTANLLGVTPATMSAWLNGRAVPSLSSMIALAELFEISTDRILQAGFADLLEHELSQRDRYERVEQRIRTTDAGRR